MPQIVPPLDQGRLTRVLGPSQSSTDIERGSMNKLPNPAAPVALATAFLGMLLARPAFSDDGPPKEPGKTQEAEKEDERPAKVSYKNNAANFKSY